MASLLDLFVRITADNSEYKQALKESRETTEDFASLVEAAGGKIATSLSFAGIAAAAVEMATEFEEASVKIQRATGATGESLDGLEESFKNLYAGSSRSAEEISGAMSQVAIRTGLTGAALEDLTGYALKFAKVTGTDVATAVTSNEKLFAQWGIATKDQSQALDVLYVASQKSGIGAAQLGSSMASMGPVLRSFGFSFQEAAGLIATFEKSGLDATEVTRGLQTAFISWAKSGADPKQALSDLIKKMSETTNAADAVALAVGEGVSKRAAVQLADAARNGALDFQGLTDALDDASGAVGRMADKTDTFHDKWVKLTHAFGEMTEGPGSAILSFFTVLTEGVTATFTSVSKLWELITKGPGEPGKPNLQTVSVPGLSGGLNGPKPAEVAERTGMKYLADHGITTPAPPPGQNTVNTPNGGGGSGDGSDTLGKVTDHYHAIKQESDGMAVLIAQEYLQVEAHQAVIQETAKFNEATGASVDAVEYLAIKQAAATLGMDDFAKQTEPATGQTKALGREMLATAKYVDGLTDSVVAQQQKALEANTFGKLADSAQYFGITTTHQYEEIARVSGEKFDQMLKTGVATERDLAIAALQTGKAEIDADYTAGRMSQEKYLADKKAMDDDLAVWQGNAKQKISLIDQVGAESAKMAKSMFSSIEKEMATDIVHWKGFQASVTSIFQKLGTDVTAIALHALFKPLEDGFVKLISKWITQLAAFLAAKVSTDAASTASETASQTAQTAATVVSSDAQVTSNAAVAGAEAFAAYIGIPFAGPALAAAAEAAAIANVLALLPMASAAGGIGDVPYDDMPTLLHRKEMVLPADIAVPMRQMVASTPTGNGGMSFHGCTFSGVTRDLVAAIFNGGIRQARFAGAKF